MKKLLIIALAVVVGLFLAKNLIASAALTGGVKMITGLDTHVKGVSVGLANTAVGVKGLRVMNPSGFPDRLFIEVPEIYIDYDLGSFLKGKAHLETVRLHLSELHVIKAKDGRLNLNSVKALESGKAKEEAKKQPAGKAPQFQIDLLELKVGKVIYKDFTKSPPIEKEFAVNINERYERIANPYAFAGLVVSRALMKTTVSQLANFDVQGLQADVTEALKVSASQLMTQGTTAAEQLGKDALGGAGETVQETTKALKKLWGN